jgi:4-carboxymuconolactone decarboxylase
MDANEAILGGRLPLLDPKTLEGDQKALYERMQSQLVAWADTSGFEGQTEDGKLIGPFNPYLYSTGITPGFLDWLQADSKHTSLNKRVHEVVILSVGGVWKSPYELYAHSAVARTVGIPEAAVQALVAGRSSDELSREEQVAHQFARQLTAERKVDADLYREAESLFGRTALVDMVYLIGMYLLTCALLNAFEIPAPEKVGVPTASPIVPTTPLKIAAPLEIGLCVADLDRSLKFYRDLLGLSFESRIEMPEHDATASGFADSGYTVVRLQLPTGERIKLFSPSKPPRSTAVGHRPLSQIGFAYLTLIVADLSNLLKLLHEANVREREPGLYQLRGGVKVALVEDPDGNVIELIQYDDIRAYRPDLTT